MFLATDAAKIMSIVNKLHNNGPYFYLNTSVSEKTDDILRQCAIL